MHAEPNHALREIWRNPVFALSVAFAEYIVKPLCDALRACAGFT